VDSTAPRPLIRELVAISAAYAVSCSTSLETHVAAARALGATDRQVFAAIKIACAIKDVANGKVKSAAGAVLGLSEEEAAGSDCAEGDAPAADRASGCQPHPEGGAAGEPCCCGPDKGATPKGKGKRKGTAR
jgi:AhpD family alkylhydroperoxidase